MQSFFHSLKRQAFRLCDSHFLDHMNDKRTGFLFRKIGAPSAWSDYLFFVFIVFFSISSICIAVGWIVREKTHKQAQDRVLHEAQRIRKEISYLFDETQHLMTYLGKEIVKSHTEDFLLAWQQAVSQAYAWQAKEKKSFLWPDFGWIDKEKRQIFNTKSGLMPHPQDMSIREYTRLAPEFPWTLQFAKPGPSIPVDTDGAWILPMGMGITDEKGTYLGCVASAYHIPDFIDRIEKILKDRSIAFILFDLDGTLILQNLGAKLDDDKRGDLQKIALSTGKEYEKKSFLSPAFYQAETIEGTPYVLIAYLDQAALDLMNYQNLIPHYLKLFGGGGCCLLLAYFFLHNFIKKNWELQHAKNDLEQAFKLAEASDLAKEEFLGKIRMELMKPFIRVVTYADILLKHVKGEVNLELSPSKQIQFLNGIREAAIDLKTLSTSVLDLSYIDVKSILEDCIRIHAKQSFMRGIRIKAALDPVPPLYADELRFKQIIVGLLSRAIRFSPKNETIHITASISEEEETVFLKIILQDFGYGLTEEEWQRVVAKYSSKDCISRCSDGTDLELSAIERLVLMHRGKCIVEQKWKRGTIVHLLFPYRKAEECQTQNVIEEEKLSSVLYDAEPVKC